MNELFPDAKSVVLWLFGAVMTLFGFIGKRHLKDFDDLKSKYIPREEVELMHEENGHKLDAIDQTVTETQKSVTKTHERIDQLYRDLMNR